MNRLCYLLFILSFLSCKESRINYLSNDMSVVIYDSIDLPDSRRFSITSFDTMTNSFVGLFDTAVVCFDENKERFRFERFGKSEEEYHYAYIVSSKAHLINDSVVAINSYGKLKFYSKDGKYLKTVLIDNSPYYYNRNLMGYHLGEDSLFVFEGSGPDSLYVMPNEERERRENPYIFSLDTKNRHIQGYGLGVSQRVLQKELVNLFMIKPLCSYNGSEKTCNILFNSDTTLYIYPLDQKEKRKYEKFVLTPQHYSFPEEHLSRDDEFKRIYQLAQKSVFKNIYTSRDTLITLYRSCNKIDGDEYTDQQSIKELWKKVSANFNRYLEVYINKKKICNDILLPDNYRVRYIGDMKNILMTKNDQELLKDNKVIKRFYFAKIIAN
ncbi:MAG: hypothetical protein ACEPOV_13170 [Hyphomicrobiales bacterium]